MTSYLLKIIAVISMFLDHFARLFTPSIQFLTYIGRLAFPIFAFQASIGYSHTKDLKKYMVRLFIFAIISQIPYTLYFKNNDLNVIFTILFGIISIYTYEKCANKSLQPLGFLSVAFIAFLAEMLKMDYGCYGVLIIFMFYIAKNSKILTTIGFSIFTIIHFINKMMIYGIQELLIWQLVFTLSTIIPILFYNEKEGKKTKYLLYIFYPAHLLILYLIKTCLLG